MKKIICLLFLMLFTVNCTAQNYSDIEGTTNPTFRIGNTYYIEFMPNFYLDNGDSIRVNLNGIFRTLIFKSFIKDTLQQFVKAPTSNTADYIPLWDGANSKKLKNGLQFTSLATASTIVSRNGFGDSYFRNVYTSGEGNFATAKVLNLNNNQLLYYDDMIKGVSPSVGYVYWNGSEYTFQSASYSFTGTGIIKSTAGTITYLTDNSANWNTAYAWGNHSGLYLPIASTPWTSMGYLQSLSGAVLTTGNQSVGGNKTYTGHADYTNGTFRLPSQAQTFPGSGDIYFDANLIKYYEGSNIRSVASQNWVEGKGYIIKPTDAYGLLVNDDFGNISWGGGAYLQTWWENNYEDDYVSKAGNETISGNKNYTGSIANTGTLEKTFVSEASDSTFSIANYNTFIVFNNDIADQTFHSVTFSNMIDGQQLFVSNDKDSLADIYFNNVINKDDTDGTPILILSKGESTILRYRNSESRWYAIGY